MAIYLHGEVQPQRKSRHLLMREFMTREIMRSRDAQCNTGELNNGLFKTLMCSALELLKVFATDQIYQALDPTIVDLIFIYEIVVANRKKKNGHGFESRWSPDFFRLLLFNCLNWKIYCEDHSPLWSTTAVQIYELFHIYFTSFDSSREIWTQ